MPLVTTFIKKLFIQRSTSVLQHSTVHYWASMYTLGRRSWVDTQLPAHFYQMGSPHTSDFEGCPIEVTSFTVHYIFFKGTCSVVSFDELMGVSLAGLKHFLK